jgi:hypothetical protein
MWVEEAKAHLRGCDATDDNELYVKDVYNVHILHRICVCEN